MMTRLLCNIVSLMLCIVAWSATAESAAVQTSVHIVSKSVHTLAQPQATILSSEKVFQLADSHWRISENNTVHLEQGKNWLAIDLTNHSADYATRYFSLRAQQYVLAHKAYIKRTGEQAFLLEQIDGNSSLILGQLTLKPHESLRLYLAVTSRADITTPIEVMEFSRYQPTTVNQYFSSGFTLGAISAMALIMLCVFLANMSKTILLLTGYFIVQALHLAVIHGYNLFSLSPGYSELHGMETPILSALAAILILWFSSELFKLTYLNRKLYLAYHAFGWLMLAYIISSAFVNFATNLLLVNIIDLMVSALLIALGLLLIRKKEKLAHLFMAIVLIHVLWQLINVSLYGWQQMNVEMMTASYLVTGVLIIFLLSRQSTMQVAEKHLAQREALENAMESRKAQEQLLTLQEEAQEQLELSVQERTLELNIALQELEEANRELAEKNTLDELTGLYNRRYYDQKLLAEFRRSRRNLTPLSLVVIDIDHFKSINDNYGHTVGDQCLVELSKLIKMSMRRSSDIACRYGGEEFCLILPETDTLGAITLAEELRQQVNASGAHTEKGHLALTISCGVSTYQQQNNITQTDIFNVADQALYRAKQRGRNQVQSEVLSDLEQAK